MRIAPFPVMVQGLQASWQIAVTKYLSSGFGQSIIGCI